MKDREMSTDELHERWQWAWCAFNDASVKLPTTHLSDEVVNQDVAIHLAIGEFGLEESRKAVISVGYLVGNGTAPNRMLSEDERAFVASLLRHVAGEIEKEPHSVMFQAGE